MTKDVKIIIEGMESDSAVEGVTTKATGTYHLQNGKHYVQYDEKNEEDGTVIKNVLKFTTEQITVKKDGAYKSLMIFDPYEVTHAQYGTPYGIFSFHIHTTEMVVMESEDEISITLQYNLSDQDKQLSKNRVMIRIISDR